MTVLTNEMTQEYYERARATLNGVIWSPQSSDEQKAAAQAARTDLTIDYIGQQIDEIAARTAQFRSFIERIEGVLTRLGRTSPLEAVQKLGKLAADAKMVLDSLEGLVGGGARSRGRGVRGASRGRKSFPGTTQPLRVLCVHGVGQHDAAGAWMVSWARAMTAGLQAWNPAITVDFKPVSYDDMFQQYPVNARVAAEAIWRLGVSGIVHGVGDLFRRTRGMEAVSARLRWTAGMVAQWAQEEDLRRDLRRLLARAVREHAPDVVCAHSLGSLVAYDTFVHEEVSLAGRTLVTFGSQIGNPFVRNAFGGRISPLEDAARWYHLFNPNDDAFTARVRLVADNFVETTTAFDLPGLLDHEAEEYLRHPNTSDTVWRSLATRVVNGRGLRAAPGAGAARRLEEVRTKVFRAVARKPTERALLVGINNYPDPADRLEGCVNDVFLMSSVLQEIGLAPENIRVVLDERATSKTIRDRLEWLLDGTCPGDQRFFYYSGHGAQIPTYGVRDEVDHVDECLVTHDFDWSREHCITDDDFFNLYTQLPYDSSFVTILDCCHSGGMTRSGSHRRKGIDPPDDIRHRALRWNAEFQMWEERKLPDSNMDFGPGKNVEAYVGTNGATHRLGRAIPLRGLGSRSYNKARKDSGHHGPYLPVILEACAERQSAYEYTHGVTAYGAFTFSLAAAFRQAKAARRKTSYKALASLVTHRLKELGFDQTPCLVGPTKVIASPLPFM